jgi:hypothetical protein
MTNFSPRGLEPFPTFKEIRMNPLDTNATRAAGRFAVIAILVFLAVSFAALATLGGETDATSDGIFALMGDYLAQAGEALGW